MIEIDPAVDVLKDTTYKLQSLADDIARAAGEVRSSVDRIVDMAVNEGREAPEGAIALFPMIGAINDILSSRGIENMENILDVMTRMARDIRP